jgi:hypothetical protein
MSGRRAGFLLVGLVIAVANLESATPLPANPGAQWLSWTATEKNAYVGGFIDGYLSGTTEICQAAGQFLKGGNIRSSGDRAETPSSASAACFATGGNYSKQYSGKAGVDFSVYANIITEFYTKHPDYRAVSFRKLILSLRDGVCNSEGQLYQKALRGDVR